MFNSIRGTITEKRSGQVCIETGGLEWDIDVPATDIDALPPPGETGRIFTWLYHRETEMRLFGFADERRRATFLELLKVEGIGPRGAVRIMGGIGQDDLEKALETEDLARLEAVPGLGKKTAQKMILALKGKLAFSESAAKAPRGPYAELTEALVEMGYDRRAAEDALQQAAAYLTASTMPAGLPVTESAPAGSASADVGADREQALFKQAILYLSGAR